jgi:superfamily II DNA or RNA helicase
VAIVLSGTGSTREHIQRLGRVLRKGSIPGKVAKLYEVIAEETSEEGVSKRRGEGRSVEPTQLNAQLRVVEGEKAEAKAKPKPGRSTYPNARPRVPKAAEPLGDWD